MPGIIEIILPTSSKNITIARNTEVPGISGLQSIDADRDRDGDNWVEFATWTFPELGPARYYGRETDLSQGVVVPIAGRRFQVSFHLKYKKPSGFPNGGEIRFMETDQPETPFSADDIGGSHLFGQPDFVQWPRFPHLDNVAAFPLATIQSNWGDTGNENFFVVLGPDGYPTDIYHEYSSC